MDRRPFRDPTGKPCPPSQGSRRVLTGGDALADLSGNPRPAPPTGPPGSNGPRLVPPAPPGVTPRWLRVR